MKVIRWTLCAALLAASYATSAQAAIVIPTNQGIGADAEVREETPTTNRGTSNELATRARSEFPLGNPSDGNDRNGVMYLKFDLAGLVPGDAVDTAVRLTVRNANQYNSGRMNDTDGVAPNFGRNGFTYYGVPGATFNETTLTYLNAPGMTFDGNVGTKDFNGSATLLGNMQFPNLGTRNYLPVGQAMLFSSAALDSFIANEIATNPNGVAVIAVVHTNNGTLDEPSNWRNFNYLVNPKEMLTLNADTAFDVDTTNPSNTTGSPWSAETNAHGRFSPSLILGSVPEPASFVLMGIAACGLMAQRRRLA